MRRLTLLSAAFAATAALATAAATAGPSANARVTPGVGIWKLRVGMTVAEVVRILGRPQAVSARKRLGFGVRYVEYQWNLAAWTVGFQGREGKLRAVRVGTTLRRERTSAGLGVNSRIRDVVRVYPRATCTAAVGANGEADLAMWVTIVSPRGVRTIFAADDYGGPQRGLIVEVMVQQPVAGVAERRGPCFAGWRRL